MDPCCDSLIVMLFIKGQDAIRCQMFRQLDAALLELGRGAEPERSGRQILGPQPENLRPERGDRTTSSRATTGTPRVTTRPSGHCEPARPSHKARRNQGVGAPPETSGRPAWLPGS